MAVDEVFSVGNREFRKKSEGKGYGETRNLRLIRIIICHKPYVGKNDMKGKDMDIITKLLHSCSIEGKKPLEPVLEWIETKSSSLKVSINKNKLSDSPNWFYDEEHGEIRNQNNSFFQIRGLRHFKENEILTEQPILIQEEIGYLGIICKDINGVLHLLMQAKIEPGNVNKIQISPTIQATKSNFTQKHGGRKPSYLDYFLNADKHTIIFDQIQSEQSSRFLGKRNRNIMIKVDEDIEVLPSHMWMTMWQLKQLMKIDNLVNMDTRTVLSCIPYHLADISESALDGLRCLFQDKSLFESMFAKPDHDAFVRIYRYINNYKMLYAGRNEIVPLKELAEWNFTDSEIVHKEGYAFKVIFADIEIEGREVTHWTQPLFEAVGMATFGLICADFNGKTMFLVHCLHEAGCFDGMELAPSVQLEAGTSEDEYNEITGFFFNQLKDESCIRNNVILSEEGGRFYCEQNKNIVINIDAKKLPNLPEGYFWVDYRTLCEMVQYNNVLNIQLRNLLSLLEI